MFGQPKDQKDLVGPNAGTDLSWKHRLLKKAKKKEKRRMETEQNAAKRQMIQDAVGRKRSN